MFTLLRMGFWFSIVLLFLPIWPSGQPNDAHPVNGLKALIAAQQAVSDIAGICDRQPGVCETGREAAYTIGVRARESARIAYDMLEQRREAGDLARERVDGSTTAPETEVRNDAHRQTPDVAITPTPRPAY